MSAVYRDVSGPLAIAHRGGAGLAAENTLEAFARSYALGLRYLETDVRMTSDGHLVAFHDAGLHRVTGSHTKLARHTLAEITKLSVQGGGAIVTLADVLASFPDACFTIDVKERRTIAPLARLLRESGSEQRVCIAGMRGRWLEELRSLTSPELCTALSWRKLARLATRSVSADSVGLFAHVPLRLGRLRVYTDELVERAHDAGVRVIVWTVNDSPTMHRLLDRGVDGIITDRPDILREVLVARGQWHAPDSYGASIGDLVS
jgi:glycerophosphoryl diester phosphodiesterase